MTNYFVFSSNLAGRHGAGAALTALTRHKAEYGVGQGPTGNAYALPTKDENLQTLPLSIINENIQDFLVYATKHPNDVFQVTAVGCGLAGYNSAEIAPFFEHAPVNCILPDAFEQWLISHNKREPWYFTFMNKQEDLRNKFACFTGSFAAARTAIIQRFGTRWAMQYTRREFLPQIKRYNLTEINYEKYPPQQPQA